MIAVPLPNPDLSPRQPPGRLTAATEPESKPSGVWPTDPAATVTAPFQPPDPDLVSEAIPAFYIGRNREGFWVARDVKGQTGGIFLRKNSALSFARRHSLPAACATIFPSGRIELDLENNGNPLVAPLALLMRLRMRPRQRMVALVRKITAVIERCLKRFHVL